MLKIAIDCRMIGSGGIGSFIHELIPYFLEKNECLLIGTHEQCMDFVRMQNVEFCFCDVPPFSFKEISGFPADVLQKINTYQVYFTPYCNIPCGIEIPVFSTIHDVVFLDVKELTGFFGRLGRKFFYQRAINFSDEIFKAGDSDDLCRKMLDFKAEKADIANLKEKYSYRRSAEKIVAEMSEFRAKKALQ